MVKLIRVIANFIKNKKMETKDKVKNAEVEETPKKEVVETPVKEDLQKGDEDDDEGEDIDEEEDQQVGDALVTPVKKRKDGQFIYLVVRAEQDHQQFVFESLDQAKKSRSQVISSLEE